MDFFKLEDVPICSGEQSCELVNNFLEKENIDTVDELMEAISVKKFRLKALKEELILGLETLCNLENRLKVLEDKEYIKGLVNSIPV